MYGRLTGGASIDIAQAIALEVNAGGTIGREEGNELSALIGVRRGF